MKYQILTLFVITIMLIFSFTKDNFKINEIGMKYKDYNSFILVEKNGNDTLIEYDTNYYDIKLISSDSFQLFIK